MKGFVVVLFVLLLLQGCKKSAAPVCTPPRAEYTFFTGKAIALRSDSAGGGSVFYRYQVVDGGNLVFRFDYHYKVCPSTIDIDPHRTIAFQVPAGSTSFDLADSTLLAQSKALVNNDCGECFGGIRFLTRGRLLGRKLNDNTWIVQGSVSSYQTPSIVYTVDENFIKN